MVRRKIAIIANKAAGAGAACASALSARAKLWGRETVVYFPRSAQELSSLCSSLSPKDYDAIVPIGGDGTLNQVLRAFHTRPNDIPLFPFPGGTANDLAKELKLRPDWDQVQTLVDQKKTDLIDLIEVNGVPFATVGGLGIGSLLTAEYNLWRKKSYLFRHLSRRLNFQVYSLLSGKTVLLNRSYVQKLHFRASGFDEKIKTAAVFLCNQTYLGGNLRVAPGIENNDQRFNVMIVNTCSRVKLLNALFKLKSGTIPQEFFVFSTDRLSISAVNGKTLQAFGDGELLTESPTLEFKVLPKSLRVFRARSH